MAATAENAWWWSVLELGQDSPYAQHFDIDWDPPTRRLRGSVLLPVLGDHYGRVLESGELHLERGKEDALVARYYEHVAPLSPDTADEIWAIGAARGTDVDEVLAEINADRDRVDAILNRQHHRFRGGNRRTTSSTIAGSSTSTRSLLCVPNARRSWSIRT